MVEKTCWSGSQLLSDYVICRIAKECRKEYGKYVPRKKDTVGDLQKIVHRTGRLLKGCRVLRDTMATNQSSFIPTFHRSRWK